MGASSPPRVTGRLRRTSLVDQAIAALQAEIDSGAWAVGEKIPTEPQLVERFGIGRNALREAIRALVHSGLLETRQGDGTYLRATSEFAGALRRRTSCSELLELVEVRRAIEVEAARLAAKRRSDRQAAELERLLAESAAAWRAGDVGRLVGADVALHTEIVRASGNAMLLELYESFGGAIAEAIRTELLDTATYSRPTHSALVAAIVAGDPQAAAAATAAALDEVRIGRERRSIGQPSR
ncbi:FadR/GntR family transcriptional regulator [Conexibacter arvalis]|uniref:DNA-binding FadR family transcriptional regulator n=1 Tax=Conexibacter arvalis TaxID=912552 RepID=A0A840IAY8_9ACTN|nr:FCD domain-containing protein [Conexibacter arvalis]MBB4661421.1 DNA-binding FadR family transcriptional regulator [Conexibacter arvalis]